MSNRKKYYDIKEDYPEAYSAGCNIKCVYVVQFGDEYKIGISAMPRQRLLAIQSIRKRAFDRYCLILSEKYDGLEDLLHRQFEGKRLEGEWFRLSEDDFQYLKQLSQA